LQSFADRYASGDAWAQRSVVSASPGTAWIEDFTTSMEGRFGLEWLKPQHMGYLLRVVILRKGPDRADPAEIAYIMLGRDVDVGCYSGHDLALIDELLPHLQRALKLQWTVSGMRARYRAVLKALDALSIGVVLIDQRREPIVMNECARESLGMNGTAISALASMYPSVDGRKGHAVPSPLIRSAVPADVMFSTVVRGLPGLQPLIGTVCRLDGPPNRQAGEEKPAAIVFLRDPSRKVKLDEEMIRHLHGLTRAEAHLAVLLAEGGHLDEVARRLNISMHTARTHLKRIFSKTNTERQIDLVRLLLNPPMQAASFWVAGFELIGAA
jgi:DNA-binding CsgD family transcriptional regulator